MFYDILGNCIGTEYKIELLEEDLPYHPKPFPIPNIHEGTKKTVVNRLVDIDVLNLKIILNGQRLHL